MKLFRSPPKNAALYFILGGVIIILVFVICITIGIIFFFPAINPNIAAGIIAASATVCVSVFSVAASKLLELNISIANEHRAKKMPVYEDFISFLIKILQSNNPNSGQKQITQKEMVQNVTKFSQSIIVWGSNDVINAWYEFKHNFDSNDKPPYYIFLLVENIIRAIRKELGHSVHDVPTGKLLGLLVNDIEEYFKDGKIVFKPLTGETKASIE